MKQSEQKLLFPISVAEKALKVHPRTLRIWDEEGILKPTRTKTNRRAYSASDIILGEAIKFMTNEMALNLNAVKCVLFLLPLYPSDEELIEKLKKLAKKIGLTPEQMQINKAGLMSKGRKRQEQE